MTTPAPSWADWRRRAQRRSIQGVEVAVYDLGDLSGAPVTFLHGFPSSSLDVAPVLPHLDRPVRLVAVDLPGFGASGKPRDHPYSIHAAVDVVEEVWHHLDVGPHLVVAHDYSVSVAQELLARRSRTTSAVLFMNGGLYPDLHRPTPGQLALLDPEHGADVAAAIDEESFVRGVAATWGTRRPFDEHAAREMFRSMAEAGGVAIMHLLLHYVADRRTHAERWSTAIDQAHVPLAFVWGDLDPVSGAHMIERVEQRRPDARIVRLPDAGHWPSLEAPEVVGAEVHRLLP